MEPIVDGSGDTKGTPLPASTTPWLADLDRGLAKAVTVGAVIGVTTFTLDPAFAARYDARMSLVHVAFAVAALGCVADVLFGDGIRRGARAFVLVGVVVIVAMPFLFPPDAASPAYPPFVHVVTVAALAAPYAVSPAAGSSPPCLLAAALAQRARCDRRLDPGPVGGADPSERWPAQRDRDRAASPTFPADRAGHPAYPPRAGSRPPRSGGHPGAGPLGLAGARPGPRHPAAGRPLGTMVGRPRRPAAGARRPARPRDAP